MMWHPCRLATPTARRSVWRPDGSRGCRPPPRRHTPTTGELRRRLPEGDLAGRDASGPFQSCLDRVPEAARAPLRRVGRLVRQAADSPSFALPTAVVRTTLEGRVTRQASSPTTVHPRARGEARSRPRTPARCQMAGGRKACPCHSAQQEKQLGRLLHARRAQESPPLRLRGRRTTSTRRRGSPRPAAHLAASPSS